MLELTQTSVGSRVVVAGLASAVRGQALAMEARLSFETRKSVCTHWDLSIRPPFEQTARGGWEDKSPAVRRSRSVGTS